MKHLREGDCTLGDLMDAFAAIAKKFPHKTEYAKAMPALTSGMEAIMKDATELSEEQAQKQFASDRSMDTFVNFLRDHKPDGMKKYAKAKGFKKDQFLELAKDEKIVPGDMIGFYRKSMGIEYAHAGIYAPIDRNKYVVHVQAKEGLSVWKKRAEVKYKDLKEIIKKDDRVFYIRKCGDSKDQAEVLSKVKACLFETPIEYTYNGHFGSCQTFCSKVLGSSLFEDLNPEAFLTTATTMKAVAGWFLSSEADSMELVDKMKERFNDLEHIELPQDEILVKTCPESLLRPEVR